MCVMWVCNYAPAVSGLLVHMQIMCVRDDGKWLVCQIYLWLHVFARHCSDYVQHNCVRGSLDVCAAMEMHCLVHNH
jgi:hypothetical protein